MKICDPITSFCIHRNFLKLLSLSILDLNVTYNLIRNSHNFSNSHRKKYCKSRTRRARNERAQCD